MDKTLKPIEKDINLLEAEETTRAEILNGLPRLARLRTLSALVESAMLVGLTDVDQIVEWLGAKVIGVGKKSISFLVEEIKQRWVNETEDVVKHAKEQRAIQVSKAWDEVRQCEKMIMESETLKDKIEIKKLLLSWMQYLSKLTFVDRLVDGANSDTQIMIINGVNSEKKDDGN